MKQSHSSRIRWDDNARVARVSDIVDALHREYHEADLGNLPDPVDELVYISLTRQTHRQNANQSWKKVMGAGGPAALVDMPEEDLAELLQDGGFSCQKTRWIKRSFEIVRTRMGALSLNSVTEWPDPEVDAEIEPAPAQRINILGQIVLIFWPLKSRQHRPNRYHHLATDNDNCWPNVSR